MKDDDYFSMDFLGILKWLKDSSSGTCRRLVGDLREMTALLLVSGLIT